MSQRPKRGGEKSPRDSHPTPLGSLRAGDGGGTAIISEDFANSGQDDADLVETEGQEALLALQSAIDGLSQSQLLSIKDLLNKAAQPTRAQKSLRLRTIVDEHLQFLLTLRARDGGGTSIICLLYTSPSPRDGLLSRMPSSA